MKFSLTLFLTLGSLAVCHADAVRLQVNGPDGEPIVGAKVRVVESKGTAFDETALAPRDFVSDAKGSVAFESRGAMGKAKEAYTDSKSRLMARVLAPGLAVKTAALKSGNNTVDLVAGQGLEGMTLDAKGMPIANVRLSVGLLRKGENYNPLPRKLEIEARSDAQGHWKMEGLPLEGIASVQVRDARFKNEIFPLDLKQTPPPFFLEPGAGVKGRLLRPDGTPAKGVKISSGGYGELSVTDANGRFAVMGITGSSAYLQLWGNQPGLSFIVAPRMVNELEMGQTRDIGDWKAIAAIRIQGKVVDKKTHKPVANASLSNTGRNAPRDVRSDKNGAFTLLVAPGTFNLTVRAPGFARLAKRGTAPSKTGAVDVGVLALRKSNTVSGVVVDKAGIPVSLYLYVEKNGSREYIRTNFKDGAFIIDSLTPGKYTLKAFGAKIVSGATFSVGAGAPSKLRVVIGEKTEDAMVNRSQNVVGRVVDEAGQPIGGAKVFLFFQNGRSSSQSPSVVSQSDGSFTSSTFTSKGTGRVLRVIRPGYVRAGEQAEAKEDGWHITLTLQKSGQVLRGRVVNSQGQGIAGTFVCLQDGDELPVATDGKGDFALVDAPQSGVTLLASNGPSFSPFTVAKVGQEINIVLPDATPLDDKGALADKVLQNSTLDYNWTRNWDVLGSKRIEALVLKGVAGGLGNGQVWEQFLEELAHREPQNFLSRESELQAATPISSQTLFQRLLMLSRAKAGDVAQKAQVTAWLDEEEKQRRDLSMPSVMQLLYVAEVAAQLNAKQGAQWFEYADQIMGQLDLKRGGDNVWELGRVVARISPEGVQTLSQDWTPSARMQLFLMAMQTWNADRNLKAAQIGWQKMNRLLGEALKHPDPKIEREGYRMRPADMLTQARGYYALLLARTNPKAALDMVMALKDSEYQKQSYLLGVARFAVWAKQPEVAGAAVKALSATTGRSTSSLAEVAEIAYEFDPAWADTLWARVFAQSHSEFADPWVQENRSDDSYARTRALKWPGESRVLIEREWQKRLQRIPKKEAARASDYFGLNTSLLSGLVEAMARVSPLRALAMVDALPQRESFRARTRMAIALALLQVGTGEGVR